MRASAVSASPALQAPQSSSLGEFSRLSGDRPIQTHVATYCDPNGGTDACWNVLQNSDFMVALREDT
ncbi:hypothetical protein MSAN_01066900 [Mycena sanguinolenta]|uniref:Uncharacterized protein n=1 Tax=Mycena sanguinolenta TaxID=230812 RepID=A0A8H6YSL6_9AGAR|nr:hypothetical protein MSAN_01066900 [Mycena sanguinolenta]